MPRAGLSPDLVVLTAAEIADDEGLEAVTPSAVARRLGVRPPSIYAHVDGAGDLRRRLLARALDESADRVAASVAGRAGAEAVRALAAAHRDWAREHPGRYAATRVVASATEDDDASTLALAAGRRHADLLRAALRDYRLDGAAEVHAVRAVGAFVHGFIALELAGAFAHSQPGPEASWAVGLRMLLVGIDDLAQPSGER